MEDGRRAGSAVARREPERSAHREGVSLGATRGHCGSGRLRQSDRGFCRRPSLRPPDAEPDTGDRLRAVYQEAPGKSPYGQGHMVEKAGDLSRGGLPGEVFTCVNCIWHSSCLEAWRWAAVHPTPLDGGSGGLCNSEPLPSALGQSRREDEVSLQHQHARQLGEGHPKLKRHFGDLSGPQRLACTSYIPVC